MLLPLLFRLEVPNHEFPFIPDRWLPGYSLETTEGAAQSDPPSHDPPPEKQ